MTVRGIVGLQWGDEGKGKIVDKLAGGADLVARAQGGDNAGHTVVVQDQIFKLHLLPSGAVREGVPVVIGNGVVANPLTLAREVKEIESRGLPTLGRLFISGRAHLLLPFHQTLDGLNEERLGKANIGTTKRGIGPCYTDKAARRGIRWHQALDRAGFARLFSGRVAEVNRELRAGGVPELDATAMLAEVEPALEILRPRVADTETLLRRAWKEGKNLLLEGAQGAMLDLDFGTYPFVTSSNTTSGGLCTGTGLPPTCLDEVHGVLKAFTTRVGSGPFLTELQGEQAAALRGSGSNQWDEYGTTTGRPRRCGWLDLAVARYSCAVNGVTHLHITKLDVMGQFDQIKVCTAYRLDGKILEGYPCSLADLERCEPVYETVPGWKRDISTCANLADLPADARAYVELIARHCEAEIGSVSYGPGRAQTVFNLSE